MAREEESRPDPGRRRRVDQVGEELAALRRELDTVSATVRDHGGHLAEVLPQLEQLAIAVTALTAAAEEQERESKADRQARREAGLLDEPPSPWCWPILDRPTAEQAWRALGAWCATVLCREQQLPLRRLPACWPRHPAAVAELTALRAAHVAAVRQGGHPAALLSWQRELPTALDRLTGSNGVVDLERCPPGLHLVDPAQLPPQRERDRVGAMPCLPEQWHPLLERVSAADVATRREAPGD